MAGMAAMGCTSAAGPAPDGQAPDGWDLVLDEGFDGDTLDQDTWGTCHWWAEDGFCTLSSTGELERYGPDGVDVADGTLRLTARDEPVTTEDGDRYEYTSGMISSGRASDDAADEPRFAFTYGYAEARLRVPAGRGLWSAFWLLPVTNEPLPEIDVVEVLGDTPSTARHHFHWALEGRTESEGRDREVDDLSAGWHTFAVDWRPGRIIWLVDGEQTWELSGPAISDEPMYPVINLAVGGDWPGDPDGSTEFPATLEVDHIRVWQQP